MPMSPQLARIKVRLDAIPQAVRDGVKPILLDAGIELAEAVKAAAPKDKGDLAASVAVTPGRDNQVVVTAGNAAVPYAAHIEYGHCAGDGTYVPPEPYFWPAYRAKRAALRAKIKAGIAASVRKAWGG